MEGQKVDKKLSAYILELFTFGIELLHLNFQLAFRLIKFQLLRSNDLDDSIIHVQCTHPFT